jgi:2-methylcitrate dehydratase PrpD
MKADVKDKGKPTTYGARPLPDRRTQLGAPAQEVGQTEGHYAENPKPIITGDSQAQGIAKFASRVTYEDLTPERRERLKVSVLDSLACAINALGVPPIVACLEQAKQFGGSDARCTLIGGGKANVVYAAQYNTALVRYIDFMDSYLGGEELCHPSDNVGAVLAACEHAGRSGKEFLAALAVAYQVESALDSAMVTHLFEENPIT